MCVLAGIPPNGCTEKQILKQEGKKTCVSAATGAGGKWYHWIGLSSRMLASALFHTNDDGSKFGVQALYAQTGSFGRWKLSLFSVDGIACCISL